MGASRARRAILALTVVGLLPGLAGRALAQAPAGEGALRSLVGTASRALSDLDELLDLRDAAGALAHNAACVTGGSCDLGTALEALRTGADGARENVQQMQSDGNRPGGDFGARAAAALLPAAEALPRWSGAAQAVQSNAQLAQKSAQAQRATLASLRAAADYLKWAGIDTRQLEAALPAVAGKR